MYSIRIWVAPEYNQYRLAVISINFKIVLVTEYDEQRTTEVMKFRKIIYIRWTLHLQGFFRTAKGTIQFPLDKPIPFDIIKNITEFRVEENREKLWKKK